MKKLLIIPLIVLCLLTAGCSKKEQSLGGRIDGTWVLSNGIERLANSVSDLMVGSSGATTTADLFVDVSKNTLYAQIARIGSAFFDTVEIGSLTLTSEIITPMIVRYAAGSAYYLAMTVASDGKAYITNATSTNPYMLAFGSTGYIGVGIANPSVALEISGTASSTALRANTGAIGTSTSATYTFDVNGNSRFNGTVGIGNNNWLQGLDASGNRLYGLRFSPTNVGIDLGTNLFIGNGFENASNTDNMINVPINSDLGIGLGKTNGFWMDYNPGLLTYAISDGAEGIQALYSGFATTTPDYEFQVSAYNKATSTVVIGEDNVTGCLGIYKSGMLYWINLGATALDDFATTTKPGYCE